MTTLDPTTQSLPINTFFSIIVLDPINVFLPIFTFLPIKTLFPNLTVLYFFFNGDLNDESGWSTSASG